jgi:hypothetical protein
VRSLRGPGWWGTRAGWVRGSTWTVWCGVRELGRFGVRGPVRCGRSTRTGPDGGPCGPGWWGARRLGAGEHVDGPARGARAGPPWVRERRSGAGETGEPGCTGLVWTGRWGARASPVQGARTGPVGEEQENRAVRSLRGPDRWGERAGWVRGSTSVVRRGVRELGRFGVREPVRWGRDTRTGPDGGPCRPGQWGTRASPVRGKREDRAVRACVGRVGGRVSQIGAGKHLCGLARGARARPAWVCERRSGAGEAGEPGRTESAWTGPVGAAPVRAMGGWVSVSS